MAARKTIITNPRRTPRQDVRQQVVITNPRIYSGSDKPLPDRPSVVRTFRTPN